MGAAVVLGQGLAEGAGAVGDGAAAVLAAGDRQVGDGDREAAGLCLGHLLLLCLLFPLPLPGMDEHDCDGQLFAEAVRGAGG